jgi:acyl-coenzyme A synthetase/AMP-(fatty) acid ligase
VLPALISGGCLHVIPYETSMDGTAFARYTAAHPLDVLKITPSHLGALLATGGGSGVLPRKHLLFGGEALSWDLVRKVRGLSDCAIINHYGPTETTVGSLTFDLAGNDGVEALAATVPIGRPLANTEVYLLDSRRQPVPVGVAGELVIGGAGVAQGYLNQPEQTAERFIADPFSGRPDAKLYRTGDLARRLPDGAIEFLGRLDQQIKIRGFRVEPAEVEGLLGKHSSVRQAVVVAREDKSGEKRLVAYLVPQPGKTLAIEEPRTFLLEQLPDYMVPTAFVPLDALPLTANGKLDRKALPDPDQARLSGEKAFAAPRNAVEEALAAVWVDVLGVERVGIHDNFFDLGGHSLLATQVISRACGALQVQIPLRSLFEKPTVAGLAEVVAELKGDDGDMDRMLAELEGLSEEEVQRLLAAEMQQG